MRVFFTLEGSTGFSFSLILYVYLSYILDYNLGHLYFKKVPRIKKLKIFEECSKILAIILSWDVTIWCISWKAELSQSFGKRCLPFIQSSFVIISLIPDKFFWKQVLALRYVFLWHIFSLCKFTLKRVDNYLFFSNLFSNPWKQNFWAILDRKKIH